MKIAAVVDEENYVTPLEYVNSIMIIDDETKQIKEYENPGFGSPYGGKERCMQGILSLKPDAIVVKEGVLCPGSYHMSLGKMKYIPTDSEKLDEIIKNLENEKKNAVEELDFQMFRE
jgi:predicted Fe-Mo cluster-binding NifX family protein